MCKQQATSGFKFWPPGIKNVDRTDKLLNFETV
jgi:hypothetical protein